MGVMVDLYCTSYTTPPQAVTLDIDDTVDVVYGHQQLSLFNAHYDERCFLPSTSTTPRRAGRSRCCCAPARRPRQRGAWASAPPGPPHPAALATDPDHHPRRRPLRPPAGAPALVPWVLDVAFRRLSRNRRE